MAPGIVRLVAQNPGPFTFHGTNTYLVGTTKLAVIDPGPDDEHHRAAILKAAAGRTISHILVTHAHRDHSDGAAKLAALTHAPVLGYGRIRADLPIAQTPLIGAGEAFVDVAFAPDIPITHGDVISTPDWTLHVVHTPGHAPDHLCFAFDAARALFSGDHMMAWNTTVIAPPEGRMADYMASLEFLLERRDRVYLPGHGGRLEQPQRMVKAHLVHRQMRERAILAAIRDGAATIPEILARVYVDLGPNLEKAASMTVLAHLEHMVERGIIACEGVPDRAARFWAV